MICRQILRRSVWSAGRRLLSSNGNRVSDDRAPVLRLVDRSERVVSGARSVYVSCRTGLVELELGCLRSGVLHLQNKIRHRCRASSGHGVKPPQNRYKIICVGRNDAAHAKELGKPSPRSSLDRLRWLQVVGSEPVMFMKPTSSYLENGGTIEIPEPCESLDHEVELAALIHKRARDVPKANAMDYVEGYALALDMTARELQSVAKSAGVPWTMAKGQDTFTPIGSVNPYNLRRCYFSSQVMLDVQEPGIVDVPLAQTGEGIAECELLQWFVQEGDLVDEFQRLCEVQSDKATIEITSRYKGRVAKVLHDPGSIVKVGATLLKMSVDDSAAPIQASIELSNAQSTETVMSDLNDQSSILEKNKTRGVLSTPSVRSIAKQYAINIEEVSGSGRDGRVMKEDVLRFAAQKGLIEESSSSSDDESVERRAFCVESLSAPAANDLQFTDSRVPVRGYQRAMVKTMTAAAKVPHFHYVEEINCDALVKLKATFEKENADPSVKHTFLPLLIKSLSLAMSKFPFMNACFDENSQDIILKGSHNIGVAMATPHGLVVPNIKKVQSLSILEITKELSRLQLLARDNKLGPDDVSGGTITLSNIGAIGGKFGSPLLNLPEVAIIAMGRIEKVPRFDKDGDVYPSSVVTINMGADHRVLDGATVARFCNEWKSHIEKPELLLLQLR